MDIQTYNIVDLVLIIPSHIGDERGYFAETFRADIFALHSGEYHFVQDNESRSARVGTIRGLHFQSETHTQSKLVRCTAEALLNVGIHTGSATYGLWVSEGLTHGNVN